MYRVVMTWGECEEYVVVSVHKSRKQAERRMSEVALVLSTMGEVYHVEVTEVQQHVNHS